MGGSDSDNTIVLAKSGTVSTPMSDPRTFFEAGVVEIDRVLLHELRELRTQYRNSGNPMLVYRIGVRLAEMMEPALDQKPYQLGCLHQFLGYLLINANQSSHSVRTAEQHLRLALTVFEAASFSTGESITRYLRTTWLLAITIKMQNRFEQAVSLIKDTLDDAYFRRAATMLDRLPLVRQLVLIDQTDASYGQFSKTLEIQQLNPVQYFHSARRLFEFALNNNNIRYAEVLYRQVLAAFKDARPYLESVHVWSFHKNLYHYFRLLKKRDIADVLFRRTFAATTRLGLDGQRVQLVSLSRHFESGNASDLRLDVAVYRSS